jgi:hypothetical protein
VRTFKLFAAVAGIVSFVVWASAAHAQNAAQRAALVRLGIARPEVAPPSGVPATSVPLDLPGGLAFDASGNFYGASGYLVGTGFISSPPQWK